MECDHVEEYRQPWEDDAHWALRKDFIEKHWTEFKEYTLLCLAQVYADVELHKWSYPIPALRYVRVVPSDDSESAKDINNVGTESVVQEEPVVSIDSESSSGKVLQKRTSSEVSGTDVEGNDPELSNSSKKRLKITDLTVSSGENSSLAENGKWNFAASNNALKESPNRDNETEFSYSLAAIHIPVIEDLQHETQSGNVSNEVRQSSIQTVQESDALSIVNPSDEAMGVEPLIAGNITSVNMNSQLESSVSKIQLDAVPQILGGNIPQRIIGLTDSLPLLNLNPKLQCGVVPQTPAKCILENVIDKFDLLQESKVLQTDVIPQTSGNSLSNSHSSTKRDNSLAQNPHLGRQIQMHSKGSDDTKLLQTDTVPETSGNGSSENGSHESGIHSLHLESSCSGVLHYGPKSSDAGMVLLKSTCNSDVLKFETHLKDGIKQSFPETVKREPEKISCIPDDTLSGTSRPSSPQSVICLPDSTSIEVHVKRESEFDTLPESLKANFTDALRFIWKLRGEELSASEMLERLSERYNLRLDYRVKECLFTNMFKCSLEIEGVSIGKGRSVTRKGACREAGRLAFDKLMLLSTEAECTRYDYHNQPSSSNQSKILAEPDHDRPFFIDVSGGGGKHTTPVFNKDVAAYLSGFSQNAYNEVIQHSEKSATTPELTYEGNFCGINNLPENLKTKFIDVSLFILASHTKRTNPVVIMHNVSEKARIKVEFVVKQNQLLYECSLRIGNILVSKTEADSIRKARFKAARIAIDELTKFLQREGYTYSACGIEESKSCKTKKKKKKLKANQGSDNKNQKGPLTRSRCNASKRCRGVLPNTHIVYENSEDNLCDVNTASPLRPLNDNFVASYGDKNSGFIPLNSSGGQEFKRKRRIRRGQKSSKIFAILDYSDVTQMDCFSETLLTSASFSNVQCEFRLTKIPEANQAGNKISFRAEVMINGEEFCNVSGRTKKKAKEAAGKQALLLLKKSAYTVKVKCDVIKPDDLPSPNSSDLGALPETNIGYKMLKVMGWTGGGLGRPDNPGIEEPIEAKGQARIKRGLGFPEKENGNVGFMAIVRKTINDYIKESRISHLIFSSEFRPWQRKLIARFARRQGLFFQYFDAGNRKYTIVSKHLNAKQLVDKLLRDGHMCTYELIPPSLE